MTPDPSVRVWLLTFGGEIHKPATTRRTTCGMPCTTGDKRTHLGVSTTWGIAARYSPACPVCWPDLIDEENEK